MDINLFGVLPYIPGSHPPAEEPLSRYLPPIPNGIVTSWLAANIPEGSLILDPFGASPRVIVEAARAGHQVVVSANNPIVRFLLELNADPPSSENLRSSLAELAASYIGEERIEPHIRALYNTYCTRCGQIVSASAFLWEHDNPAPYARIYTCPSCGDSGEHPSTSYDAARASQIPSSRLHKARALERVVAANDQDRIHVEQALSVYIPRALYALITIINKLQALNISAEQQKHLAALLLYAFDQSNAMWKVESPGDRRRSLTIPRHFRENNVWNSLEEGIDIWGQKNNLSDKTIPITIWPELPPTTGGICIFEGRFVNIIDSLQNVKIKSVCAAIPRPNQAFWTLSALWAGWLWGREAVGRFKSVLHRQRYDWAWHATALSSVFKPLLNYLDPSTPIFGIIGEAEPAFIGAALVAANIAGCHLESIAIRPEENQAQILWKSELSSDITLPGKTLSKNAIQSAQKYLETTAEPTSYLNTMAAAFMGAIAPRDAGIERDARPEQQLLPGLASPNETAEQSEPTPSIIYSSTYNQIRESLTFRAGFLQYNLQDIVNFETTVKAQSAQSSLFSLDTVENVQEDETVEELSKPYPANEPPSDKERLTRSADITESTLLWLRESNQVNHLSYSDKYEAFIVDYLHHNPGCYIQDLDNAVCQAFPGLFTPESHFLRICLESYGQPDPNNENLWYLRPEDNPDERKVDIKQAHDYLHQIGKRLGFECMDAVNKLSFPYVRWILRSENVDYWFFISVSSTIGEIVLFGDQPPARGYIVFPGSRANLLLYKLSRDLRLNKAFTPTRGVWQFLKFRHLKSLSETPLLNRENLDQFLSLDPLTFSRPQLWLI